MIKIHKLIVAGSRDFNDYHLLERELINLLRGKYPKDVEIVCGGARGADSLGERFAKEKGCNIKYFMADWDGLGKKAGFVRNAEMGKYANDCILFWDGVSKGTKHMYDLAIKYGIEPKVINY